MKNRARFRLLAGVGALILGLTAVSAAATPASANTDTTTCDFADANGGGQFPTSICWIDFSGYNSYLASTPEGQHHSMSLGAYDVSFTVTERTVPGWTARSVVASPTNPTVFPLGSPGYYEGISGSPILYSTSGDQYGAVTIGLSNFDISLDGVPVDGYSLISASPETLDAPVGALGESLKWTSDQPLTAIDQAYSITTGGGCTLPIVGDGTTSVDCNGAPAGTEGAYGVIVSAPSATAISGSVYMAARGEREGLAFGLQTARVSVSKQVDSRVDAHDAFDVSVNAVEGGLLASASTGDMDTASTGSTLVIPNGPVTLSEEMSAGSTSALDYFDKSWSCTNTNDTSGTLLPSGSAPAQSLDLVPGDDVSCTVTNTAKSASLSLEKSANVSTADAGDVVTYDFEVSNTGALPVDSVAVHEESFSGSGTLSEILCPATSIDAGSSITCEATYEVTQADVDAGVVTNSATATARIVNTSTSVEASPSEALIDTSGVGAITVTKSADVESATSGDVITYTISAENTGPVTLTDVTLVDDGFSGAGELGGLECDTVQPADLAPGAVITCTVAYTVTADDSGTIDNVAVASGVDSAGTTFSDDDIASVDVVSVEPTSTPTASVDPWTSEVPSASPHAGGGDQLAYTGAAGLLPLAIGAFMLSLGGLLFVLVHRRRA